MNPLKKAFPTKCFVGFLVLLMLLSSLAGCKSKKEPNKNNDPIGKDTSSQEEPDSLDGVSFDEETIEILSWKASNIEEYVEEDNIKNNIVQQAVYKRTVQAELQLNMHTKWKIIPGNNDHPEFIEQAQIANQAGGTYDLFVSYSSFASSLTVQGLLQDLRQYEVMDFTKPWWAQKMVDDCTIADKLYFCTGDISSNLMFMSSIVFFNKTLKDSYRLDEMIQEEYDEDDLYDLVRAGKWTYDALITLSSGVYRDVDNDYTQSAGDLYGFGTYNTLVDNFYYGAGLKTVEANDEGLEISRDFSNSDVVVNILRTVGEFMHRSGYAKLYSGHAETQKAFASNLTLFSLAPASHAYYTHSKTEGLNYGALPVPKYQIEQDGYSSVHSLPYSMYCISAEAHYPQIAAAFLQCLGKRAYSTSRIAIYEESMRLQYADGDDDSQMWEYIANSQTFDLGRIFCRQFGSRATEQITINSFRSRLQNNSTDWASVLAKHQESLDKYAQTITDSIKNLP